MALTSKSVAELDSRAEIKKDKTPQGSILGPYLFCATTDNLDDEEETSTLSLGENGTLANSPPESPPENVVPLPPIGTPVNAVSTPTSRGQFRRFEPPGNLASDLSQSYDSDDENIRPYFRLRRPVGFESSSDEEGEEQAMRDVYIGPPPRWEHKKISVRKYIDDFSAVEKVPLQTAGAVFSTRKTEITIIPQQCQKLFKKMSHRSKDKGMRINERKTQILCISSAVNAEIRAEMMAGKEQIESDEEMKLLGFFFGKTPDVGLHVCKMLKKFRAKLWSMFFLKNNGMNNDDLKDIYKTVLLPILDYAVPTYHSMLNSGQREAIERLQRRVYTIIYGKDVNYDEKLTELNEETLEERRSRLFLNFARKASAGPFANKFPLAENQPYNMRKARQYKEFFARTDRLRNSPIFAMRRELNRQ